MGGAGCQLALNRAWSWLFFGLQEPGLALADIVALLAAILMTIVAFWREDRIAAHTPEELLKLSIADLRRRHAVLDIRTVCGGIWCRSDPPTENTTP